MILKKIILPSFAAFGVAGVLSACSNDNVAGTDEQSNSVAEGSSSSVVPGSSNSLQDHGAQWSARTILRSVSQGTAATVFHMAGDNFNQIDSVTAHETYDGIVQLILDYDVTLSDTELVVKYDTLWGHAFNSAFHAVMRDEDDVVHEAKMYVDYTPRSYSVYCHGNDLLTFYDVSLYASDSSEVLKTFRIEDFTLLEQFRQDCALENGTLDSADFYIPEIYCTVAPQKVDSDPTYKDPNWKKFTTGIAEGCVSTTENLDSYFDWIDL